METFWGPYFWFWGTLFDFYFKIWEKLLYPPKTRPCHLSALMVFLKRLQVAIGKPAFLRSSGAQCPVFLIVFAVGIPWVGFMWLYVALFSWSDTQVILGAVVTAVIVDVSQP